VEGEIVNPVQPTAFVPPAGEAEPRFVLSPGDIPNVEDLVIEDGKPVDNIFVEKEYRLLSEPLYSSWTSGSGKFLALANVDLFYAYREPPLVPDVMLSLGVPAGRDLARKENQSYFMWVVGKPPDVVIEIVSDLRGGEETDKWIAYAHRSGLLRHFRSTKLLERRPAAGVRSVSRKVSADRAVVARECRPWSDNLGRQIRVLPRSVAALVRP